MFRLNVSDSFANTMGQMAGDGAGVASWHVGFNLSRKFY
jgi:hypothetical protein